ncbi:hypothetical protein D3C77_454440 [compost metagenome]
MALTYAAERCAVTLTTHRLITELNEASSPEQPILSANEESVQFSAEASGPLSIEQLRKQVARILQEEAEAHGPIDS